MRVLPFLFLLAGAALASTASWGTTVSKDIAITITPSGATSAYLSASNLETPSLNSGTNTTIPNGGRATLTWDSTGAGSCVGSGPGFSTGNSPGIGSVTVSPTTTTPYSVNCGGSAASVTVTVSGTRRDAAASFCAANGGGNGSSGSPWQAACIQAAINASSNGDTIFLAAGNWELKIANAGVELGNKNVNIVGAGSGNTFDIYGHPMNGAGPPVGTVTEIFSSGGITNCGVNGVNGNCTPGGGWFAMGNRDSIGSTACGGANPGPTAAHFYVDGSRAQTSGPGNPQNGDTNSTFSLQSCHNATWNDIRALNCCTVFTTPETNIYIRDSANSIIKNSIFTMPIVSPNTYSHLQILQFQDMSGLTFDNLMFYGEPSNPIYVSNFLMTRSSSLLVCDGFGCSSALPEYGDTGCGFASCSTGETGGSHNFTVSNSVFDSTVGGLITAYGIGGGVNDPGTAGTINNVNYIGNWVIASQGAAIDSCEQHLFGNCPYGQVGNPEGMQINGMTVTNNSIISGTDAHLTATGTGCTNQGTGPSCGSGTSEMTVVNFSGSKNYLQSPSNAYDNDAGTITPSVSGNFCSGSSGGAWCATAGFTTPPTVSFTLGTLSNSVVPLNNETFTAQYGAVQWLASTSPTTPITGGQTTGAAGCGGSPCTWNRLPPISLPVTHGSTVYMWVMDSANHISAPASAAVP